LTFRETGVVETSTDKTLHENVVEICKGTFPHCLAQSLNGNYLSTLSQIAKDVRWKRGETGVEEEKRHGCGLRGNTFESFEEMIALKDGIVFPPMPRKLRNNAHQTLIWPFRTLATVWRLPHQYSSFPQTHRRENHRWD
jgi:hypothetical protein